MSKPASEMSKLTSARPGKVQITLRIDVNVVQWFKDNHPKYSTAINDVLRGYAKQRGMT